MSLTLESAFADAHHWHPEPAAEAADEPQADSVTVALRLLVAIAEDPHVRPSHRMAARRHLRRLERATGEALAS